jgi:hypothetical protein
MTEMWQNFKLLWSSCAALYIYYNIIWQHNLCVLDVVAAWQETLDAQKTIICDFIAHNGHTV